MRHLTPEDCRVKKPVTMEIVHIFSAASQEAQVLNPLDGTPNVSIVVHRPPEPEEECDQNMRSADGGRSVSL